MSRTSRVLRLLFPVLAPLLILSAATTVAQAGPGRPDAVPAVADGTFDVVNYRIEPYRELGNGSILNRFHATDVFHGDIQGQATAEAQMITRPGGSSSEVGFIHVVGTLGGRTGGFVIQTVGEFDGTRVRSSWTILAGSGTGDLEGLRGSGVETAVNENGVWLASYRLTYHLP